MANEAIIVELLGNKGDPVRYTCADGTAIPKGTIMQLETPRTVVEPDAVDKPVVGICATEKVASDGQTSVAVYTNGIFIVTCEDTQCEIGDSVSIGTTHDGRVALSSTLDVEKGWSVGYALETIAIASPGMIRVNK